MGLKEIYDDWQFKAGNSIGRDKTPKEQKDGRVAVDFLPNTYQTEVRNRTPGNKVVTQATADDATTGMFTATALGRYTTLFQSSLRTFKNKIVHKYNARGTTDAAKYETANKNEPGVLYTTTPAPR
jgi:hypothetical protein